MTDIELTAQEKAMADEIALERVEALNSDEYFVKVIDAKIQQLENHVKAYVEQRVAFLCKHHDGDKA